MLTGNFVSIFSFVGKFPGYQMVKGCTQTVNVTADIRGHPGKLFRTDVLRSPHNFIIRIQFHIAGSHPGKSQVCQFCLTPAGQHNIIRLDILMDDLLFRPRIVQRIGNTADNFCGFTGGDFLLFFQDTLHRVPVDQFHGKVIDAIFFADSIGLHNIGMADPGRGTGFPDEIFYKLGVGCIFFLQDLQGYKTIQRDLSCEINHPHPASGQFPYNSKISDHRSCGSGFRRYFTHGFAQAAFHFLARITGQDCSTCRA